MFNSQKAEIKLFSIILSHSQSSNSCLVKIYMVVNVQELLEVKRPSALNHNVETHRKNTRYVKVTKKG